MFPIARKKENFNYQLGFKAVLIAIIAVGLFYLSGTNDLAVKSFKVSELKRSAAELAAANGELELQIMQRSAFGNLTEEVSGLKMVAAADIKYISSNTGLAVAKK